MGFRRAWPSKLRVRTRPALRPDSIGQEGEGVTPEEETRKRKNSGLGCLARGRGGMEGKHGGTAPARVDRRDGDCGRGRKAQPSAADRFRLRARGTAGRSRSRSMGMGALATWQEIGRACGARGGWSRPCGCAMRGMSCAWGENEMAIAGGRLVCWDGGRGDDSEWMPARENVWCNVAVWYRPGEVRRRRPCVW